MDNLCAVLCGIFVKGLCAEYPTWQYHERWDDTNRRLSVCVSPFFVYETYWFGYASGSSDQIESSHSRSHMLYPRVPTDPHKQMMRKGGTTRLRIRTSTR